MTPATDTLAGVVTLQSLRRHAVWLLFAAVLLALPLLFTGTLATSVLNQMGIAVVFALSYNMLLGQGGMLSFGHAVFFGLGGFMAVHFLNYIEAGLWLPVWLVPLVGGLFGLVFGVLIGSVSTRRAGTVFAMISLGFGELVASASLIFVAFFGGEEGVSGDRTEGPELFGVNFAQDGEVYYLIAAWVFLATLLMYLFSRTPAGRMANAVRDNPERAEFIGYSQRWVRFLSLCGASFFAGIAGGLFAINYEILTEENLNLVTSGSVLLMAYIGGVGFFAGPIVGAVLFTLLQTVLSNYTEIWQLYVGALFVATVMFAPTGLTGLLMMHAPAWRTGRLGLLALPYAKALLPAFVAFLGAVGLLEMTHHVREAAPGTTGMTVFYMAVDTHAVLPWLAFALMLLGGGWLARRAAPDMVEAWDRANRREGRA